MQISQKTIDFIAKLPTTQIRILSTVGLMWATAIRYFSSTSWKPDWEWLTFLLAAGGVDAAQWISKRVTDHGYVAAKNGVMPTTNDVTSSTDISELQEKG